MIREILNKYWGYDDFRPLQSEIIMSILEGHDTLGMLPTGGGKSITFQVPAIAMGGLTLVITPLISLMKDQCDHLLERGIKAAAVFMGMTHQEVLETYERVISEDYRFLYISPERLETRFFQAKLQYMDVRLLVVDEAHCISQWGYDFRPPYLRISKLRQLLREIREQNKQPWVPIKEFDNLGSEISYTVPCLALTATATTEVIKDIQDKLNFRKPSRVFKASFERPNLTYSVIHTEDKLGNMLRLLGGDNLGSSAIVYVRSRRKTAEVAEELTQKGIPADYYHAGLEPTIKQQRQDAWMAGNPSVIVATNAFGMGIDKPNVRKVIHIDLPPSPEEYFQEAGRAGRDGEPADAILLVSEDDKNKLLKHLVDQYPAREYIRKVYGQLASFFQIAIAAGLYNTFEFDIWKFCTAYHYAVTPAHYALKLLDQAEYIKYIEEPDRHSRLMFITSRESLYHLDQFDKECQRIIQALLRLYTGLFADYVYIREDEIMKFTGFSRELLYEKLLLLSRFHVLHYIPARQQPAIMYLTPRLENEEIKIPYTIYEERQARQERRIKAMIGYVENNDECRLVQLLKYFGEELDHRCGHCDVCLSQDLPGNVHEETEMIRHLIIDKLKARGPLAPQQLFSIIKMNPERVADVLHSMVEDEELTLTDNIISLPK
jgi:ATP-dependent DNA helicase RecQ